METTITKCAIENYGTVQEDFNKPHSNSWVDEQSLGLQDGHGAEATKASRLHSVVEAACSAESCAVVNRILQQVDQLSDLEKLLLYLKLPAGKSNDVDPLKIPLNPLGSRFEIQQTIMWIRTHLEEDQDVSMPKHEVYDEYQIYCTANSMKGLSTADFGKVMKQVFPRVRPRRLGTRGHSRYCYAGLRRKSQLEAPQLPDVDADMPAKVFSDGSGEASASSSLIRQWAEKLVGERFETLSQLSSYLVKKNYVSGPTPGGQAGPVPIKDLPAGCLPTASRHRETQLQLQRKLHQKEIFKEQKKKQQDSDNKVDKGRGRKRKKAGADDKSDAGDDMSVDDCLSYGEPAAYTTDYSSWVEPPTRAPAEPFAAPLPAAAHQFPALSEPESSVNMSTMSGGGPVCSSAAATHCGVITSTALSGADQAAQHTTFVQPAQHNGYSTSLPPPPPPAAAAHPPTKLDPLQPKFEPEPEYEADGVACGGSSGGSDPAAGTHHSDYGDHMGAHDHEEELMQYFNNKGEHQQKEELSQLRMLLEQNLPSSKETQKVEKPALAYSQDGGPHAQNGAAAAAAQSVALRRRVSFQPSLSAPDGVPTGAPPLGMVPPSPNTRRRYFNFQPIGPEPPPPPPPPAGVHESPFVSPHSTPIPLNRSRNNSGQLSAPYLLRGAGPGTGTVTPFSAVSELSRCATFGSENSTPFLSPQSTPVPFQRSRHNSSQQTCRFPQVRSRHSSGALQLTPLAAATSCRQTPAMNLYSPMNPNPYSPMSTVAPCSPHMSVDESGIQTSNFPTPDGTPSVRSRHSSSGSGISPISAPVSPTTSAALLDSRAGYSDLRRRHQSAGATVHYRPLPAGSAAAGAGSSGFDSLGQEVTRLTENAAGDSGVSLGVQRSQSVPPTSLVSAGAAGAGYVFRAPPAAISQGGGHLAAEYGEPPPAYSSSNLTLAQLNTGVQQPIVSQHQVQQPQPPPSVDADLGETLQALSECDDFSRLMMEVPQQE